jgi:type III secretion protein V
MCPLPTPLLGLLVSVNIATGVVLLLVAIYISDAPKVATFPTLLPLTTLFRVVLEVSATRLILLETGPLGESAERDTVTRTLYLGL